jgi:DNA-binding response OmpR family regulator
MRVMLIDDDPRYRALLRHHLTCTWPDAVIVAYNPAVRGPLCPEFLAQGFDAVLLDHGWEGGDGSRWLADLAARGGFAPVIFLAPGDDPALAGMAREAGAFAVLPIGKVEHERLIASVRAASRLQAEAQAGWRECEQGREAQRFGGARIPGYRRARRLASGSVSDLYLAESFEAGEMVALKVTRDSRRPDGVDQTFERFLQEYEIVRTSCTSTTSASPTTTRIS